jgi:hypothetical protein
MLKHVAVQDTAQVWANLYSVHGQPVDLWIPQDLCACNLTDKPVCVPMCLCAPHSRCTWSSYRSRVRSLDMQPD